MLLAYTLLVSRTSPRELCNSINQCLKIFHVSPWLLYTTSMTRFDLVQYIFEFYNFCTLEWCDFCGEKRSRYGDINVPKFRHVMKTNLRLWFVKDHNQSPMLDKSLQTSRKNHFIEMYFSSTQDLHNSITSSCGLVLPPLS